MSANSGRSSRQPSERIHSPLCEVVIGTLRAGTHSVKRAGSVFPFYGSRVRAAVEEDSSGIQVSKLPGPVQRRASCEMGSAANGQRTVTNRYSGEATTGVMHGHLTERVLLLVRIRSATEQFHEVLYIPTPRSLMQRVARRLCLRHLGPALL